MNAVRFFGLHRPADLVELCKADYTRHTSAHLKSFHVHGRMGPGQAACMMRSGRTLSQGNDATLTHRKCAGTRLRTPSRGRIFNLFEVSFQISFQRNSPQKTSKAIVRVDGELKLVGGFSFVSSGDTKYKNSTASTNRQRSLRWARLRAAAIRQLRSRLGNDGDALFCSATCFTLFN